MKRLIMIYLFLCVSASMLFAQLSNTGIVPSVEWQHCLGGSGSDKVISAHTTLDKSNVIFGNSNSTSGDVVGNHGGYDIWVVIDLIDATGKRIFSQKQEKTNRISTEIPVSRLSKGIYLLKIATEKGYMTKEIMIGL